MNRSPHENSNDRNSKTASNPRKQIKKLSQIIKKFNAKNSAEDFRS